MVPRPSIQIPLCAILALTILIGGCTITQQVPNIRIVYPPTNQIDMKISLTLTQELCNAKWERQELSRHYVLSIGSALCQHAEAVARSAFTEVLVLREKGIAPSKEIDAVLIPGLAAIERNRPATIFGTQTTSILFTWSLNDLSGAPLWATTIAGDGKGPMGSSLSQDAGREQLEMVLNDVFQKSFKEITTSKLIQAVAADRRRSKPK